MCAKEKGLLNFSTSKTFYMHPLQCVEHAILPSLECQTKTINKTSAYSKLILSMELTTPKPSFLKFNRIFSYTKSHLFYINHVGKQLTFI